MNMEFVKFLFNIMKKFLIVKREILCNNKY